MDGDPARWIVHCTQRVYTSEWINVDLDDVEVPGGHRFAHHVLRFPRTSVGAVVLEGDSALLLWRHRFTVDAWGWEIPAGWSDPGEEPERAVRREIEEETGYRVASVQPLTTYHPMSGISSQRYQLFTATGAQRVSDPEAAEASRVEWIPLPKIRDLIASGGVPDGPSLTALAFVLATC